ncbi:diaminopimelate epimerase [Criibacterium bergeronii]|uniref:Diaminopimelate epimerase n=1 Tax=Criibacterium bergeronii TaxID=1871336 RepID=A0A552V6H2_9FIRM|nr:diaminopimelate epimerase [Criibacterium bergeronii]TRW26052.1 diaminopimelate epimerase [Criibacterium bergeronii]
MKLNFVELNPCMNKTVFILDDVPVEKYAEISEKIISYENLFAEQVGFLKPPFDKNNDAHLHMMGGEFCGNATRSLAAYTTFNNQRFFENGADACKLNIEVFGQDQALECNVTKTSLDNTFYTDIQMPLPIGKMQIIDEIGSIKNIKKIDFNGITHFSVDDKNFNNIEETEVFFGEVKNFMEENQSSYMAFGIMFYDYEKSFMTPLVYVKGTDSLFWEKSCASGTSAFASMMTFEKNKSLNIDIAQPGGSINVNTTFENGKITKIILGSEVSVIAKGQLYVNII